METIQRLGFEQLPHPPYSPDSALSDYRIFGPMKVALLDRKFSSNDEVQEVVQTWLREQSKTSFSDGIQNLVHRYHKCVTL